MKKIEKIQDALLYILCPVLALSICANIYLVVNNRSNRAVVSIDGQTVMTQKELNAYLNENYKTMVVNEKVGQYLLILEGHNRNIADPTDDQLQALTEDFAAFMGYANNVAAHREKLTESYFVHEIFMDDGIDDKTIQTFLEEYYGDRDTKLYELSIYETHDHNLAVEIQELLEAGTPLQDVEAQMGIEFITTYAASMENVLSGGLDVVGAGITNTHNMSDMENMDSKSGETGGDEYSVGDVFHVMDSDGMEIVQIGDILGAEKNRDVFENLYFSQRFTFIRNTIVNELKGKHVISYY